MLAVAAIYIVALAFAAIVALRLRSWWLATAAAGWCAMAVMVTLANIAGRDTEASWLRYRWLPAEWASLTISIATVIVTVYIETAAINGVKRFWLRFGAIVTPISMVGLMWFRIHHNDWYWVLVDWRARAWQWAALFLGIVCWSVPHWPRRDTLLLLSIAMAHAVFAPLVHLAGPTEQGAYRLIASIACFWWAWPRAALRVPGQRIGGRRVSHADDAPPLHFGDRRRG